MHNWPGLAVGSIGAVIGPVMASMDTFEIAVTGLGSHAAMPHLGRDPIVAGANLVSTLQTIASRSIAPTDAVVVSVTQFHAGDAWNVIPETVNIRGTVRTLDRNVQKGMEPALRRICEGLAHAHGIAMDLTYTYGYPVTVNTAAETEFAREVAGQVVGADNVQPALAPSMGRKTSPSCWKSGRAATSGSATGRPTAGASFTTPLRLQRRHPAHRRRLLGRAGGACPARARLKEDRHGNGRPARRRA